MKRKILSTLLIIVGLFIIAYPKALELYNDHKQQRIIKKWEEDIWNLEENNKKYQNEEKEHLENEEKVQQSQPKEQANAEGILKIDKINLKLPVLSGATQNNLSISLASVEHTGKPGEIGNYAIAGHRSHTYGRNFNRLDEIEIGDIIEMNVGDKEYKYIVVDKLYVKPEEIWVLKGNNKDREITLITCHPMINPTHRLIIKGRILGQ